MPHDYSIHVLEYGQTIDQAVGVALYGAYNEGIKAMPYGFIVVLGHIRCASSASGEDLASIRGGINGISCSMIGCASPGGRCWRPRPPGRAW